MTGKDNPQFQNIENATIKFISVEGDKNKLRDILSSNEPLVGIIQKMEAQIHKYEIVIEHQHEIIMKLIKH